MSLSAVPQPNCRVAPSPFRDRVCVMSVTEIGQMSRLEKVRLMEAIWEDLSHNDADFESPSWHQDELRSTEDRLAAGKDEILDWSDAKKQLRRMFE